MVTPPASFTALIASLLVGGISVSLAVAWVVRRPAAREALERARGRHLSIVALLMVGIGGGGTVSTLRTLLEQSHGGLDTVSPFQMLVLGASIGLPFSVPGVLASWSEARRRRRTVDERRDRVPTKDDRRAFALRLAAQIRDVSPRPREVEASVSGDGGTVLVVQGDIDPIEGEHLTAALREELRDAGFKRVEGHSGRSDWWTRV